MWFIRFWSSLSVSLRAAIAAAVDAAARAEESLNLRGGEEGARLVMPLRDGSGAICELLITGRGRNVRMDEPWSIFSSFSLYSMRERMALAGRSNGDEVTIAI